MNENQVKGTVKDAVGKVQEKVGEVIGSREQEAKGIAKQVEGKAQKGVGNVQEAVDDASRGTPRP
ncbi:MAG: CsbD family protein [Lautropia sp.]